MKTTDCELVLRILKDMKPHRNFDIIDMYGAGFALAARIGDLKNPKGKYKLHIESGTPKKFGKEKRHPKDWYYRLVTPEQDKAEPITPAKRVHYKQDKQLSMDFIRAHKFSF